VDRQVLRLVDETDGAWLREVLSRDLDPLPAHTVAMCSVPCPDVSGIGPYDFEMPCTPLRCGDLIGQSVAYHYTSTAASPLCYRETPGPAGAILGEVAVVGVQGRARAGALRQRRKVLRASAEVGGDTLTSRDFLPMSFHREFTPVDGADSEAAYRAGSTSRFTNIRFQQGGGTLVFSDRSPDPRARFAPRRVLTARCGSLDDVFPELIRVLRRNRPAPA
jgi:hypothetical protein